jgi:predicted aspartyl protease
MATIDTGFNGYLELPESLWDVVSPKFIGQSQSLLAGGHVVTEDQYAVTFPFDGDKLRVRATFAPGETILMGTRLLFPYRLTVDFPERRVWLEREA